MRALFACIALVFTCASARADVVAMLSVKRDPNTSERDEWAVTHAVTDFFAERHTPVVLPHQAQERLGADYVECQLPPCAPEYIESLQADLAVGAVVFAEGGEVQAVNVAVIRPDGLTFTGSKSVEGKGVNLAAREAMMLAWERYQRGPGPWLEVRGQTGHRLVVDGELKGALPYRDRVDPGVHQLRVETQAGTAHYEATVHVPDDPAQYTTVDAHQANLRSVARAEPGAGPRAEGTSLDGSPPAARVSPYNYVAGGGLLAVGAYLVTAGALTTARDGQCTFHDTPPCDAYNAGTVSNVMLATGAVLSVAGITWLAWRPLRVRPELNVDAHGAVFTLRGTL